jgi:hypothetical protein
MGDISAGLDLNSRINLIQNTNDMPDTAASESGASSPINENDIEEYLKSDLLELSQIAMRRMSTGLGLSSNLNYIQNNDNIQDDSTSSSPTSSFQASIPINEGDLEDYLKTDILELSQIINRRISKDLNLDKKFNNIQASSSRYESRTTSLPSPHSFQIPFPVNQPGLDEDLEMLMDELNNSPKELRDGDSTAEPNIIVSSDNNISRPIFTSQAISLSQKPRLRKRVCPLKESEIELPRFNSELGRDTSLIASTVASKNRSFHPTDELHKQQDKNQQNHLSQKFFDISQGLYKEVPEPRIESDPFNIPEISISASRVNVEHANNITVESELERSKITLDKQMTRAQQDNELLNMLEEELEKYYADLEFAISENAFAPLYRANVTHNSKKVAYSVIDKRLSKPTQSKRKSQSKDHPDSMSKHISTSKEFESDRSSKRTKVTAIVTNTYSNNLNSTKFTENVTLHFSKYMNEDNSNALPISDKPSKSNSKCSSSGQPSSSGGSNLKLASVVESDQHINTYQKPNSTNRQIESKQLFLIFILF